MFVRYFVELPLPFERAQQVIDDAPGQWVTQAARAANASAQSLLVEVGLQPDSEVEQWLTLDVGDPVRLPARSVLPLTWRIREADTPFRTVEADVEVAAMGANRVHLSVAMQFHPPLAVIRRSEDRALLGRVAEAMLKDFVELLADEIVKRTHEVPARAAGQ